MVGMKVSIEYIWKGSMCYGVCFHSTAPAAAKSLQSCPTLCDPIDGSPPGSPIPGILQTRTLEWVAISFSDVWKWKVKVKSLSHVRLLATPWTAAHQAPLSMGFSRQEYWSGQVGLSGLSKVMFQKPRYTPWFWLGKKYDLFLYLLAFQMQRMKSYHGKNAGVYRIHMERKHVLWCLFS